MKNINEIFGCNVWTDEKMEKSLPKETYQKLKECLEEGKPIDLKTADIIASAMKEWAVSKGATHYTHWFFPMTGLTAEKHEGFINEKEGKPILEFLGKELIKGEPDASSFPSGGIRETFEARGYTVWDPTSYVFVKDHALYIPTAFCSYNGEALDKKTPLLRSMDEINKQSLRLLRLFGDNKVKNVKPTVGVEQEYFLVPKSVFEKREDLVLTGKTLFGAKPPKTQELDDHYYGTINANVKSFMEELNEQLYELGIFAKTEHKEVAPLQYELACKFENANVSLDHNQLVMELMKRTAINHDLVCVFHEKPFDYINGSGKHNNWSLQTNTGLNLLDPGTHLQTNLQFLLFVSAVYKACDEYQDLLRLSVASESNDYRLGANEAPPAIISVFLGDEIENALKSISSHEEQKAIHAKKVKLGVTAIPELTIDNTDRNRTSPFAFTGNKFEFRMLGSSASIAEANTTINTIVSYELEEFANELEKKMMKKSEDFNKYVLEIIEKTYKKHNRIIFSGNSYAKDWEIESEKRGLLNLKTTPDVLAHMLDQKNLDLFVNKNIYSQKEYLARYDIMVDSYIKNKKIEANIMKDMVNTMYLPSISKQIELFDHSIRIEKEYGLGEENVDVIRIKVLIAIKQKSFELMKEINAFFDKNENKTMENKIKLALACKDELTKILTDLRTQIDQAEEIVDRDIWKGPRYIDLLFKYHK